ncbi:uncharacterized protein LOC128550034 [Mercenaria mercenaria]|uniref:uncharacterized protein LOC128550034 n=1 Tax=Mercenaria mercenaria TaxID=6596 RepID=UPI00234F5756|nr:uncharacterized protein LOC128550034 [Mercenaria mercenaria]
MAEKYAGKDSDKKRPRSELSSVSELDTSADITPRKNPKKKQNKNQEDPMQDIRSQLHQINSKLENVMTKDDGTLRTMIKDMITQMKEELLKSVEKRIEILEAKIFDRDVENEALKTKVDKLNKTIDKQSYENEKLKSDLRKSEVKTDEFLNDIEQHDRLHNVRINGIAEKTYPANPSVTELSDDEMQKYGAAADTNQKQATPSAWKTDNSAKLLENANKNENRLPENADQTTDIIIKTLNSHIKDLNLKREDIDISHRLGKSGGNKPRQIICRFTSRLVKDNLMRQKKLLPKPIYVSEDLTRTNYQVLMCIKHKMPDEVDKCWVRNGNLYFKNKMGHVHRVQSREYDHWLNLPWPKSDKNL